MHHELEIHADDVARAPLDGALLHDLSRCQNAFRDDPFVGGAPLPPPFLVLRRLHPEEEAHLAELR